jgi:enoyl-CoA hydratase
MHNILTELLDRKLIIAINRPSQMNALNLETLEDLETAIVNGINESKVKGMIITGSGTKSFIAGADISEFLNLSPEESFEFSLNGQRVLNLIENSPKPIIAAVNGYALGGGCEIAMACHLRVASENAMFGQPESKLGIIPGYGGTQRLIQYVGKSKALELMLTAEMIDVKEAARLKLVNYVTAIEDLLSKAHELLDKIFKNSPIAVQSIIKCVNAYYAHDKDGYLEEANHFKNCFSNNDFKEGVNAFIEKRQPRF